jgi:hypothetical protein
MLKSFGRDTGEGPDPGDDQDPRLHLHAAGPSRRARIRLPPARTLRRGDASSDCGEVTDQLTG